MIRSDKPRMEINGKATNRPSPTVLDWKAVLFDRMVLLVFLN